MEEGRDATPAPPEDLLGYLQEIGLQATVSDAIKQVIAIDGDVNLLLAAVLCADPECKVAIPVEFVQVLKKAAERDSSTPWTTAPSGEGDVTSDCGVAAMGAGGGAPEEATADLPGRTFPRALCLLDPAGDFLERGFAEEARSRCLSRMRTGHVANQWSEGSPIFSQT